MGDWSYLLALLDKVQSHSTVVGKIWMSVLFLFRILVLGVAADNVWADEHSEFTCNNQEPGCWHACYNWMFPISYIRYWVFQIVFVSTPSLLYLGHAVHVIHKEKRLREQLQNQTHGALFLKRPKYTDERGKVQIKGILLRSYITQLVFKILLEIGFVVGQVYIFGSVMMVSYFHCQQSLPCAITSGSECYISRPTEKTIFIIFMLVVTSVSVLLNIIEISYLLCARKKKPSAGHHHPILEGYSSSPSGPVWSTNATSRHGDFPPPFHAEGLVDIHKENSSNNLASKVKNP